jgi:hypothetical protein
MFQLLHVIPARELALGDRVHTGQGSDAYLTVRGVKRGEAGVQVTFGGAGGRGTAVLYPPNEEVAIIECVFEDQLQNNMTFQRN